MKKLFCALVALLLLCCLVLPTIAAGEQPQITLQPQNYHYPQYSVAIYTVKASGTNLHATWYLEYEGKTYNLSDNQNAVEPWEAFAGASYGPIQGDANTFGWFFGGIEEGMSGAQIWCVIEDGHYDVTSNRAIISVQGNAMPPEIQQIPAALSVNRGDNAELRCIAISNSDAQLAFQWYETTTGKLQDIRAIDGEDSDFLTCSTDKAGTRYYVCCVTSTSGGMVYSSVVPVTVTDTAPAVPATPPAFITKTLPQATVGSPYSFQLESDDSNASYSIWYNPGMGNDFENTGLELSKQGLLSGTPSAAGSYTFSVCVGNADGKDYREFTLAVVDPSEAAPADTTENAPSSTDTAPTATQPPVQNTTTPDDTTGFPWWGYLLIILGGISTGIGFAFIFINFKKKSE